jgi:FAD/FMN-containing dehydrogenase
MIEGTTLERPVPAQVPGVRGEVLTPQHPQYESARAVWNGTVDRRPAIIVRPLDAREVAAALAHAQTAGMRVTVRGGGHNVAGLAVDDGALTVDLRELRRVDVDLEARVVHVGGGATWGEVDAVTQRHGLVVPGGVVSDTGVAGLTLSGGMGWLRRRLGLSVDQLVGAEVVLADGRVVQADPSEHGDLFWAIRGGGGNFGVVTRFDFRLHELPSVVDVAFTLYRLDDLHGVVGDLSRLAPALPDGVAPVAVAGRVPFGSALPAELYGADYVAVMAVNGEAEQARGQDAMTRLRSLARPIADLGGRMPYVEAQRMLDADYPAGGRYYWKSASLERLDEEALRRLADRVRLMPDGHSTVDLWFQGGAISRVPSSATAFADRAAPMLVNPEANWHHAADDDLHIGWVRETLRVLRPWSSTSSYLNFPGLLEGGVDQVRAAFGSNYERLAAIKARYDPGNVFRRNANVVPHPGGPDAAGPLAVDGVYPS